jgi:hypothetical protein
MKKLAVFLFVCGVHAAVGQGHKPKGIGQGPQTQTSTAASPSAGPSSASGNTQLISGFYYFLPHNYQISYSMRTEKLDTVSWQSYPPKAMPKNPMVRLRGVLRLRHFTDSVKFTCKNPKKCFIGSIPSNNRFDSYKLYDSTVCLTACCVPDDFKKDSIRLPKEIVDTITLDTISRFYSTGRSPRVAAIQGDSGRLAVYFKVAKMKQGQTAGSSLVSTTTEYRAATYAYDYPLAIPHYAMSLQKDDWADSLYLRVQKKPLVTSPTYYISLPYLVWQYGAMSIPYKYRFSSSRKTGGYAASTGPSPATADTVSSTSEATSGFNLAMFLGLKYGRTHFFFDQTKSHNTVSYMFSVFCGPSLQTLTANNTDFNADLSKSPSSILAISGGFGLSVEYQSFSFGAFIGKDFPLQKNSPWVYGSQTWIGFGIGFNLGMLTNNNASQ